MFYSLMHFQKRDKVKHYRVDLAKVAYVSPPPEEPEADFVTVELGFSGGAILKLTLAKMDWQALWAEIEKQNKRRSA